MIPFRDANPSKRIPKVTIILIIMNVIAFFQEVTLGRYLDAFLFQYGVVPKKWFLFGYDPSTTLDSLIYPYFTSIFLHGGWIHLISNMWYLWIFGDNVEDYLGHARFLIFYVLCGITAGMVHTLFNVQSALPAIGASGAIAGVLGAYFILYPNARISTLIPYFCYYGVVELPATMVLGFWFIIQFFSGAASLGARTIYNTSGVAWWAHVGGFLAGIFLLFVLRPFKQKF
ncbi:MAG: rhomboid family intramembrane serine protease [Candidatus Omnitrophica bacterium]|nr:rhomboid family intramembrane serine protease [Candidatus Omnitrophota bacterium]